MSAIHSNAASSDKAVRRYHTRIKVLIHSHRTSNVLDLSNQVVSCRTGKTIKGVGQANITCVPKFNYFNIMGPNDYVNIYFDRSDGKGWVRTFFGLIDRLEEDFTETEEGPQSVYYILCSDFAKVFDRTQIYMNPHIALRDDVFTNGTVGSFRPSLTMMSAGVLMHGTPADVVSNILFATVGFGSQFLVPPSYQSSGNLPQFVQENRQARLASSFNLLTTSEQSRVGGISGFSNLLGNHMAQVDAATAALATVGSGVPDPEALNTYASSIGTNPQALTNAIDHGTGNQFVSSLLFEQTANTLRGSNSLGNLGTYTSSSLAIGLSAVTPGSRGMIDVINVGTFMERESMDGYTNGISLGNMEGAVGNTVKSLSNEIVNELFYDLRPLSNGSNRVADGTDWSTEPDEIGGNVGEGSIPNGVRYMPTVVMREYPFSTIDKIDASQARLSLAVNTATTVSPSAQAQSATQYQTYGIIYVGAIYSNNPNKPGRHVISIPNINSQDRFGGGMPSNTVGKKHLDVAVISQSEITKMKLGRSDTDVVDLFQISTTQHTNNSSQFIMKDLSPLITPIQVMHHGIRVRQLSTRYARVSPHVATAIPVSATPNQVAATQRAVANQAPAQVAPAPVGDGSMGLPLQGAGRVGSSYGYRIFGPNTAKWDYHHGVDLTYGPDRVTNIGRPITAVMDGELVVSAPDGTYNGYGCVIVLKHAGQGPNGSDLYSVYAHLGVPNRFPNGRPVTSSTPGGGPRDGRAIGLDQTSTLKTAACVSSLVRGGTYTPANAHVPKGTVIGYMGWTGMQQPSGCHLHFELVHPKNGGVWPTSADTATRPVDGTIVVLPAAPRDTGVVPTNRPAGFTYGTVRSLDPVIFYQQKGINFTASINSGTIINYDGTVTVPVIEEAGEVEEETGMVVDAAPDQALTTSTAGVANQATQQAQQLAQGASSVIPGGVDNPLARKLIARWLLLQDHWYQHNPEYLSGEITMRGAPEIRVGYRLDIKERNMSLYVESVNHMWTYGGAMTTSLGVTRGQPNNPYPVYVLPRMPGLAQGPEQRMEDSRLGEYFIVPDPLAIKRGRFINTGTNSFRPTASPETNTTDNPDILAGLAESFISSNSSGSVSSIASPLNPDMLATLDQLQQVLDASGNGAQFPTDPDQILQILTTPDNQTGNGVPSFTLPVDGALSNSSIPHVPTVTDDSNIITLAEVDATFRGRR